MKRSMPSDIFGRGIFLAGGPIENFAAKADFEFFRVEERQRMNAAVAAQNALPQWLHLMTQRGHGP